MLSQLFTAEVIEESNKEIILTDKFHHMAESKGAVLKDVEGIDKMNAALNIRGDKAFPALNNRDALNGNLNDFLADYAALVELLPDVRKKELLRWTLLLDNFREDSFPDSGTPDGFITVSGKNILVAANLFTPSIIYIWRKECEPCNLVKNDFNQLLEDPPGDIALLSVYGPDCSELIQKYFEVTGGPTVLFVANGEVVTRLVGANPRTTLAEEINIIRNQT